MNDSLVVISDNEYFQAAIKSLAKEFSIPVRACCGSVLIVDISNVSNFSCHQLPDNICHAIYFLSKDEHKRLLSTINFTFPVSYVTEKCSPAQLAEFIYDKTIDLRRRLSCRRYYNEIPEKQLKPKEVLVVDKLLQGESFDVISAKMGMNNKTVKNYQSIVFSKAFKRLDSKSLRMFKLYKELKCRVDSNKNNCSR